MNSSVLVTGFVVIGVGAMAVLFNPFASSEDTSSPAAKYQVAENSSKVTATSPVSATTDPEPFVWEDKKETVASTGILDDINNDSATKKLAKQESAKPKKDASGFKGFGSKAYQVDKASKPKQQTVSKTVSSFGGKTVSTADADLDAFFGPSKSAPKVAKTTKTKSPAKTRKPKSVRVASKPAIDSVKPRDPWSTQEVKTSSNKDRDMLNFSAMEENESDDAPMLSSVKSDDFAPSFEPIDETKVAPKTPASSQRISGSIESVLDKPAVASPVLREFNIENPLRTRLRVTFLANGKKVSLKPGQHYVVRQSDNVQVKFSRGGSFGYTEKSLSEGKYQFSVTRKEGWKLTQ